MDLKSHQHFMKLALDQAEIAYSKDEVPIGAIIVIGDQIISRSHNLTEQLTDFTAHAEMQAFTSASSFLGSKYLDECTLYVTVEPCLMCAGASFWTRIGKIVYGASDEKRGFNSVGKNILHPKTEVIKGVLEEECSSIVSRFFKEKRN